MKVAQVTGFFMPKKYGSNELFLCRELVKRGHEVTVFTSTKPRNEYSMLAEISTDENTEVYEGFTIKRFPSILRIKDVQLMPGLFKSLVSEDFDIIHAHEFFSPSSFHSCIARILRHTPFVITQHNDQLPISTDSRYLYYADACTFGLFSLKFAKKIIALTKAIRNHLLLFGVPGDKIDVIPSAIDTKKFSPCGKNLLKDKWSVSSPVILYVGRFSEVKGIKYLMEAFPQVLKVVPDAKLVLVGGGPLDKEIRAYRERFHGSIFLAPYISNDDMPSVYEGCDVVVLPSLEERFGNVAIEAMACGKPVIGSCIGGMLDTIVHEETGLHIQPRNSNQIVDSVVRILKDDKLRDKLGKNARKRALEEYDSVIIANKIEKIYNEAILSV